MLKDLKAFVDKVMGDEALQERMGKIVENSQGDVFEKCNEVAAEMGYTITEEDVPAYIDEYREVLGDEELDRVVGGQTALNIDATDVIYRAINSQPADCCGYEDCRGKALLDGSKLQALKAVSYIYSAMKGSVPCATNISADSGLSFDCRSLCPHQS